MRGTIRREATGFGRSAKRCNRGTDLPVLAVATLRVALAALAVLLSPTASDAAASLEERESRLREESPRGTTPSLFGDELEAPDTLGVGRIARDVSKHLSALQALTSELEKGVTSLGYARVRPVIARDNAEMIEFLKRGIVDVVSETPISAVHFVEEAGASIILRERRDGHGTYRSVVLVNAGSGIRSLSDLRARRIACEDAGSTTAFLLPIAAIKEAGLKVVEIDDPTMPPVEDAVAYFFTRSESSILTAVARGVADAGAMSDEDWREFLREKPGPASGLRVLFETDDIPRAFVLTGPTVSPKQRDGIRRLLLAMAGDGDGREALNRYGDVDGFDAIDTELERQITRLGVTHSLVRAEIE